MTGIAAIQTVSTTAMNDVTTAHPVEGVNFKK
jgi:hypothetical protein